MTYILKSNKYEDLKIEINFSDIDFFDRKKSKEFAKLFDNTIVYLENLLSFYDYM